MYKLIKSSNINYLIIIWTLICLMFTLTVSANDDDESSHTPELGYEINVDINMEQVPELLQPTSLNLSVTSFELKFKQVTIEVITTEGIELVKNINPNLTDSLSSAKPIVDSIGFIVTIPGQHKITIKVTGITDNGQLKDRYEYVYFTTSTNKNLNQLSWPNPVQVIDQDFRNASERKERIADQDGFVTLPEADEKLNEIQVKVPAQQYYASELLGANQVIINGRYRFRNRENNAYIGFYHNLMQLVNSTTGESLDWTYSDNEGYFTFSEVTNPDSDGLRVRAYSVRYLNGKGYGVCEYPSCDNNAATDFESNSQFYYRQSVEFEVPDGNQDIGTFTSNYSLSNNLRALWIKYDMDLAHLHLLQNSEIEGPFTAEWAGDSTHGNHYHRGNNIHLKADVGDGTNNTILHELGHNVMYNAGTFPADTDCPSPHYMNKISGSQCAWTEGWGHIFLTLVNDEPKKCSPPSTTNCTYFEPDPSYDNCGNGWDCGADADYVEGHVAGAVWDLYDGADDDFDIEQFDISKFYEIIENDTNDSFVSWWTSWLNNGNSDLALNSLFQNNIIYGDEYDIRVSFPSVSNASPEVDELISAQVIIRNLGDVSSIDTDINFYRSDNSFISTGDTLLGTVAHGVLNKNLNVFKNLQFSIDHEASYFIGACFVDSYGFDTNSSNNCSSGVAITVTDSDLIFSDDFE